MHGALIFCNTLSDFLTIIYKYTLLERKLTSTLIRIYFQGNLGYNFDFSSAILHLQAVHKIHINAPFGKV